MSLTVAELETLFTANDTQFVAVAQRVESVQKRLDGRRFEVTIDAETKGALGDLGRVESSARALPDTEFQVDADTSPAEGALSDFAHEAESQGGGGGKAFLGGFLGGLASTPIVGAITGLASDIGQMFVSAFQVEVRSDRLMATTGLDAQSAAVIARAAGEAYADNWGESIAANMDTARLAIQSGLLDPEATKRDSQSVIASLSGVADVIGKDIAGVSRTTAILLRTGLAKDAAEAFDIIVKGYQSGLDESGDFLDSLNEYSTQFRNLGLDATDALGLLRQGLDGGARDTDVAADALKEFAIEASTAGDKSATAYQLIGLNAEEMTAKVAAGGEGAREALGQVLDGLRNLEDPIKRNEAATALFNTKAEDLGDALYHMDLKTVAEDMGTLAGTAESALSTLTDNAANDVASAQRNIEVATDGIKGALAAAFGPQIQEWAAVVTENRAGLMEFLLGLANGGLDAGRAFVEFTAGSTEAIGEFIAGPLADLAWHTASILDGLSFAGVGLPAAQDAANDMRDFAGSMMAAGDATQGVAETMREDLIRDGLDPMQARLNEVAEVLVWDARVHDAQVALANDIDGLGYATGGAILEFETFDGKVNTLTESGQKVDEQIRAVVDSMTKQAETSYAAGESQDVLTTSLNASYDALIAQLEAMGLNHDEAVALAEAYGAVPTDVVTKVALSGYSETYRYLSNIQAKLRDITGNKSLHIATGQGGSGGLTFYDGGIVQPMAAGGVTALNPIAQMVPPGTLRLVGDRLDVDEAYIPLDGSPRSLSILAEAMRRMPGVQQMAEGGVAGFPATVATGNTYYTIGDIVLREDEMTAEVVAFFQSIRRRARQANGGSR